MTVDRFATPHRLSWEGHTWFFCSAGCRERFEADLERYAAGALKPSLRRRLT
jgi:Cu+-exporting ATPase